VFLPEDAQIWFNVQVETLKRVHSSWLPDVPLELLAQARKLPLGRRWLARRLFAVSPVLFGLPTELDSDGVARLKAAAWLAPLVADPMECAIRLGSLALAPPPIQVAPPETQAMDLVIRRGAAEFAVFAQSLHPAWGESVRLTYDRSWWAAPYLPSLSMAAAESCLRVGVLH
jgi:hypothetical protein